MAKISNKKVYPEQEEVDKKDYLIGTSYYNSKKTKTFPIKNLAKVILDVLTEDGELHDVIVAELQPQYHYFTSESTIPIEHGLDKYPKVTILIGGTEVTAVTNYPTLNEVVIYFSKPETGVIIIQ